LLELATLAGALIADEDAVYDPRHLNDRLLLGLRGTVSEVELHCLQARLQGARLSKVRRGELVAYRARVAGHWEWRLSPADGTLPPAAASPPAE
jgi:hypothetical protein